MDSIKSNYKKIIVFIVVFLILTFTGFYISEKKVTIIANDNGIIVKDIKIKVTSNSNTKAPTIVNINTASKEELMQLKNIGEVKAQEIIDYRNNNGLFENPSDIINVTGIGTLTYEENKDYIVTK